MDFIEISIMSLLDLFGYLIVFNKLIADTPHLYIKKKLLTIISVIASISLAMGILGISDIGDYSFIYGALIIIVLIYFLYRGNLKETLFLYIISTIVLLIEIIGNLIDNAFETGVDNNIVRLLFKKEEDMNIIEIKNRHPYLKNDSLSKLFKQGFSTKMRNGHGYGLPNIKKIIDKNNGIINLQNENIDGDNYIVFKILLI